MDRACPGPTNLVHAPSRDGQGAYLDLGDYLDGILSDEQAGHVEQHLASCQPCRENVDSLRELTRLLEVRSLWGSAAAERRGCLTAAEALLASEGRPSERAREHVASCASCRADVGSIEDSAAEQASGQLEPARPDAILALKALKAGADASKSAARRAGPRPAKRAASVRSDSSRRRAAVAARPALVARTMLAVAAAVAATVILSLFLSRDNTQEPSREPAKVANQAPEAPRAPAPPRHPEKEPEKHQGKEDVVQPPRRETPERDPGANKEPEKAPEEPRRDTPSVTPPDETPKTPLTPPAVPLEPNKQSTQVVADSKASPLDDPLPTDAAEVTLELKQGGSVAHVRNKKTTTLTRASGKVALKVGDRLRSASGGSFLSFEGGTYEVAVKGDLEVRGAASGPVLGLGEGKLFCEVERLEKGKKFVVVTHSGQIEVTGTRFSVETNAKQAVCVVDEGTVVCRGNPPKNDPRSVTAGEKVVLARGQSASEPVPANGAAQNAWAFALMPEREFLYSADFDDGSTQGFLGATVAECAFRGRGLSLLFEVDSTRFWGMTAKAPRGYMKWFSATPDLRLQFSYWLEQESPVLVQLYNESQQKFFKRDLGKQPAGKWITVTIPIMELETYKDPSKNPVREADKFDDIELYTGDTGDRWKALLDDVMLYRKKYSR
ncbi:zf-HC2 domain-containing protein [bacterium]|nr:zf-HC2 domain-containing protein [bacterium]